MLPVELKVNCLHQTNAGTQKVHLIQFQVLERNVLQCLQILLPIPFPDHPSLRLSPSPCFCTPLFLFSPQLVLFPFSISPLHTIIPACPCPILLLTHLYLNQVASCYSFTLPWSQQTSESTEESSFLFSVLLPRATAGLASGKSNCCKSPAQGVLWDRTCSGEKKSQTIQLPYFTKPLLSMYEQQFS